MIEPIKPGDDLFPYDIEIVGGKKRATRKKDWSDEKQIALNIRTIDYFLQFDHEHGSVGLINMIEGYARVAMSVGTERQKERFHELMKLRQSWLDAQLAA